MYTKNAYILFTILASVCVGDIRIDPNQPSGNVQVPCGQFFRIPSTFNYAALIAQKANDNDQFLRSNIDNEANQRNADTEPMQDMLPFRQRVQGEIRVIPVGVPQQLPLRWNNPHDSECEVNIFMDGLTNVVPIRRPFPSGGGYADHMHSFTIPSDFKYCRSARDKCVIQVYCHSVEPRTYAIGIDFVAVDAPALRKRQVTQNQARYDHNSTIVRGAIHYWDSFDTAHVDSAYSGYRGQQYADVRAEVRAAITLQSYVGNGGLVPLGNINTNTNAALRAQIQNAITAAEAKAIAANKAEQAKYPAGAGICYQGALYGVVNNPNCNREYTNTYVTNVGYVAILAQFAPIFAEANLVPYSPMRKCNPGITPVDPYGQYKNGNLPSTTPNGSPRGIPQLPPPAAGTQAPQLFAGCTNVPTEPMDASNAPYDVSANGAQNNAGTKSAFLVIGTARTGVCPSFPIPPNGPATVINPAPVNNGTNSTTTTTTTRPATSTTALPGNATTTSVRVTTSTASGSATVSPSPAPVNNTSTSSTYTATSNASTATPNASTATSNASTTVYPTAVASFGNTNTAPSPSPSNVVYTNPSPASPPNPGTSNNVNTGLISTNSGPSLPYSSGNTGSTPTTDNSGYYVADAPAELPIYSSGNRAIISLIFLFAYFF